MMPFFLKTRSVSDIEIFCVRKGAKDLTFISFLKLLNEVFMRNNILKFPMGNNISTVINLYLIIASFKNSEKLIKVKTLAPFTHAKFQCPLQI
jgi:hypothetical protein